MRKIKLNGGLNKKILTRWKSRTNLITLKFKFKMAHKSQTTPAPTNESKFSHTQTLCGRRKLSMMQNSITESDSFNR